MVPAIHKSKGHALMSLPLLPFSLFSSLIFTVFPVLALAALKSPSYSNHILKSKLAISNRSIPSFSEIVSRELPALKNIQNAPYDPHSNKPHFLLSPKTMMTSGYKNSFPFLNNHAVPSLSNVLHSQISSPSVGSFSKLLPPSPLRRTVNPLFKDQPFIVTWNIPDLICNKYNIPLDTSSFKGVATPAKVPGQFLSLFYTDRLGLYPHVDVNKSRWVNGGIPQRGNLKASLKKAQADINYYIPLKTTRGLAVIDWEAWRPLWERNWGTKKIYQTLSLAHVMETNRFLTEQQATEKAKHQFQVSAQTWMSEMLAMGRAMRPNYLWGFYLFPNCYNYGWHNAHYTGRCSEEAMRQNDKLKWLWDSSSALYPSVYLQSSLADNPKSSLMVRNRVQEALRVSSLSQHTGTAPVFVYTRPVFVDDNTRFLSQVDLVHTIGESAAVGASGAVLWGASADFDDQVSCGALSFYLTSTLNPYITNVTVAAQLCSHFLCRGNGRCVRKNYDSDHYLHLNPYKFRIIRLEKKYIVLGKPTLADLKTLHRGFTCQCYQSFNCAPRTFRELAKALMFSLKQGTYQKPHLKMMDDETQGAGIMKDTLKYIRNE